MRNFYKVIALLVLLSLSFVGWGQVNIAPGGYSPANGSADVVVTTNLELTFDGAITAGLVGNVEIYDAASPATPVQEYTISSIIGNDPEVVISGNTLTVNPSVDLSSSTTYYILIDATAIDNFTGISDVNQWRFTTESLVPNIISYSPGQGGSNISINTNLSLVFSANITAGSVGKLKVYDSSLPSAPVQEYVISSIIGNDPGVVISGNTLTVTLQTALSTSTTYYVLIDPTAITDFVGISDVNEWRFTTAAPLAVSSYSPVQNATNVPVTPLLQLEFNQDVQFIAPLAEYKILLRQGGSTIDEFIVAPGFTDGNLQFDGTGVFTSNRLNITPYTTLEVNTLYHIIIPNGLIQSLNGELFGGITTSIGWQFTTIAEPVWANGYPLTRNLSPVAVDLVGQTDKSGTYYYVVTASAISPTIAQIKAGQDENGIPTTFVSGNGVMTGGAEFIESIDISDYQLYDPEVTYYIYLVAADDVNSLDSEIGQTSFTTLERTAPVTSFNPIDGETEVSVLTNVVISFDEPVRMLDGTIIDDSNVASLITFIRNPANPVLFTANIDATKQVITIVPDEALLDNTTFDVSMLAVEDYFGNEQSGSSTSSFTTANVVVWNGNQSSDWNSNQNWDGNFNSGASVLIPSTAVNMPVIGLSSPFDITVGNINIEAGASLEINSSGSLVINNSLIMGSSTTGAGNASLIDNGTSPISVDPTKVVIYQEIVASNRSYHVSSPVSGATKTTLGVDNAIYSYNNTDDTFSLLGDNDVLSTARGYVLRSSNDLTFRGAINSSSSYGIALTRTDGAGYGWNLVGNPYTAALNWDNINTVYKNNINDAYWIFLNDVNNYGVYATYSPIGGGTNGLDNLIPSHQGFFVKVLIGQANGTLTMPKEALAANTQSVLKSITSNEYPKIKLAGVNGDFEDETIVAFAEVASNYNDVFDATKRFTSNRNYVQLFTFEESEAYAINCKSAITDGMVIPLGFDVYEKGTYQIKFVSEESVFENYDVILEDVDANSTMINLEEVGIYEFTVDEGGRNVDRFVLHFNNKSTSTDIGEIDEKSISVYSNGLAVYINGQGLRGNAFEIITLNGVVIKKGILQNDKYNVINQSVEGIYIVRVLSEESIVSRKVLLK